MGKGRLIIFVIETYGSFLQPQEPSQYLYTEEIHLTVQPCDAYDIKSIAVLSWRSLTDIWKRWDPRYTKRESKNITRGA